MYLKEDRNIFVLILLSIVTLGIYPLIFWSKLSNDVNVTCSGDGKNTMHYLLAVLLGIVTLGIYSFVWLYQLGNRLQDNAPRYGLVIEKGGGSILCWYIFGAFLFGLGPLIGSNIIITNMNKLATAFNQLQRQPR